MILAIKKVTIVEWSPNECPCLLTKSLHLNYSFWLKKNQRTVSGIPFKLINTAVSISRRGHFKTSIYPPGAVYILWFDVTKHVIAMLVDTHHGFIFVM